MEFELGQIKIQATQKNRPTKIAEPVNISSEEVKAIEGSVLSDEEFHQIEDNGLEVTYN